MHINNPIIITPRLLPGVRLGGAFVSIEYADRSGRDGRTRYQWHIDFADESFSGDDLQSGCQGGNLRDGFVSLLSFLSACGESLRYSDSHGGEGENVDLFPRQVAEWAAANSDELAMLSSELEENPHLITE